MLGASISTDPGQRGAGERSIKVLISRAFDSAVIGVSCC